MSLSLIGKALLFGGLLLLVKVSAFSWGSVVLFLAVSLFLYGQPIFNTFVFLSSFFVSLLLSLVIIAEIDNSFWLSLAIILMGFVFYIILGLKNLVLIRRKEWHYFLQVILFYLLFLILFFSNALDFEVIKISAIFLISLLLIKELFGTQLPKTVGRRLLFVWLDSLLISQFIWFLSLWPIGFISLATISILMTFLLIDITLRYCQDNFNRRWLWERALISSLLVTIICLTSRWSL
ncbi:MAG: hypothetical protein Q8Q37_01345 [bacterium]|nr:hypothetical protein [bacterium]